MKMTKMHNIREHFKVALDHDDAYKDIIDRINDSKDNDIWFIESLFLLYEHAFIKGYNCAVHDVNMRSD